METAETIETLHWRIRALEGQINSLNTPTPPRGWTGINLTEPQVQYALKDLCQSNATVFDIGANFGGLTLTMSRTVGPLGAVCAFEANPTIVDLCQINLNHWGCGNTQLYNMAVFDKSDVILDLYVSGNMVSDSLYNRVSDRTIAVKGIAMDDFIERTGLEPTLVKMDIEDAEFDALTGMSKYIDRAKPIFILEQRPKEERCLELLTRAGYTALDLRTYKAVKRMSDLSETVEVTDLLFMPQSLVDKTPYSASNSPEPVASLMLADFDWVNPGHFQSLKPMRLPAGRYLAVAEFYWKRA